MTIKIYSFFPDFRREAPAKGEYCVVCQKPIKNIDKAITATVNWENWTVAQGRGEDINEALKNDKTSNKVIDPVHVGFDCWKKIIK